MKGYNMLKKKCLICGKEFTTNDQRETCCAGDCKYTYNSQKKKIESKAATMERKFDFEVRNFEKIARAKIMLFKDGDIHRCPCDADNPERFCGSARCIADVIYLGHCHCSLFWNKKQPVIKSREFLEKIKSLKNE